MIDWSHSQQGLLNTCIRSWYISTHQKKLGVWVPTLWYFAFGGLVHEIMWRFPFPYRGEKNPQSENDLREEWEVGFEANLKTLGREVQTVSGRSGNQYQEQEAKENLKKFARLADKGLSMLVRHYRKASELPKPWLKEQKFFIYLGPGRSVKYWVVLDRLFRDGRIEDIKTGKSITNKWVLQQLLGYRAAALKQYKFKWLGENVIFHLPTHQFVPVRLLQKDWGELRAEIVANAHCAEKLLKELKTGVPLDEVFPFHPEMSVCEKCRFYFPCREKGLMAQGTFFSMSSLYGEGRRTVAIEPRF